ncbi:MAG: DMT family transporter [Albidovulum sp.]
MRLFVLTALVMTAFAANSVLNRLALKGDAIGALDFAAIRLVSGAVFLGVLALVLRRGLPVLVPRHVLGAAMLLLYVLGFSQAYLALDAGVGALILFGGVQITMFAGALIAREAVPPLRWAGAALAFAGLLWLLLPQNGGLQLDRGAVWAMAAAALGWGVYSLLGRGGGDALARTAASFILAAPLAVLATLAMPVSGGAMTGYGVALAVTAGVVTSGLGYALWYQILPQLGAARGAVAQLTVPVIAALGGVLMIGESLTLQFALATLLVLGGVALANR